MQWKVVLYIPIYWLHQVTCYVSIW